MRFESLSFESTVQQALQSVRCVSPPPEPAMKSFVATFISAAAIVARSHASVLRGLLSTKHILTCPATYREISKAPLISFCEDAQTVSNTSITIGDNVVESVGLSCGPSTSLTKRQISPPSGAFGDICACTICCKCYVLLVVLSDHLACVGVNRCITSNEPAPVTADCQTIFNAMIATSAKSKSTCLGGFYLGSL